MWAYSCVSQLLRGPDRCCLTFSRIRCTECGEIEEHYEQKRAFSHQRWEEGDLFSAVIRLCSKIHNQASEEQRQLLACFPITYFNKLQIQIYPNMQSGYSNAQFWIIPQVGLYVSGEYWDLPWRVQPCTGPTKPCERGKAYRKRSSKISLLLWPSCFRANLKFLMS